MSTGSNGRPRGAILKVSSSKGKTTTLQRPLQWLYPLEVDCPPQDPQEDSESEASDQDHSDVDREAEPQEAESQPSRARPARAVSAMARDRVKVYAVLKDDS